MTQVRSHSARQLGDPGYRVPRPDELPRYTFRQTQVGCADHGDPNCLCDVNIVTPTAVNCETITYGRLAEQIVGGLNSETFHEFASIVLGCTELAPNIGAVPDTTVLGNGHRRKGTPWSMLDDTVRGKMLAAAADKVPWKVAKLFLPETVADDDRRYIMKYYNQKLHPRHPAARRKKAETQ